MIKGLGIDLAEIGRIKDLWEKYNIRFAKKILTDREFNQLSTKHPVPRLAACLRPRKLLSKLWEPALPTEYTSNVLKLYMHRVASRKYSFLDEAVKSLTPSAQQKHMFP